ncbi:MAG: hypothetical protein MUC58_06335 [Rhizobiaceae bacterium]|nr:hypothetical protein [Rhizobiaceae bacterium]
MDRRLFLLGAAAGTAAMALPGQARAAAAFRVLRTFRVPTVIANTRALSIAPRPGGGFAALYEAESDGSYNPSRATFHGANLARATPVLPMAENTFDGDSAGTIIVNPDGSAHVFWFGWKAGDTNGDLWWMQRLSAQGAKVGAPVRIAQGWNGNMHHAVRLRNGNYMVGWRGMGSGANNGRVVNATGGVVASNLGRMSPGPLDGIAALPNGGAVSCCIGPDLKVNLQILSANAAPVGAPKVMANSVSIAGGVGVGSHPLGFAAVWKNVASSGANPTMEGGIFDNTGRRLATFPSVRLPNPGTSLPTAGGWETFHPVLLSLPDRSVVVAYNAAYLSADRTRAFYQVLACRFSPGGRLVGGPQVLYNKTRTSELWDFRNRPRSLIRLTTGNFLLSLDAGLDFGSGPQDAMAVHFS